MIHFNELTGTLAIVSLLDTPRNLYVTFDRCSCVAKCIQFSVSIRHESDTRESYLFVHL